MVTGWLGGWSDWLLSVWVIAEYLSDYGQLYIRALQ